MTIGRLAITRDSAVLWLGVVAGVIGYLSHMPPPWLWGYEQWLAAASAATAGLFLKLQTSPLKHSDDLPPRVDPSKLTQ
jgi:hypothetical protein